MAGDAQRDGGRSAEPGGPAPVEPDEAGLDEPAGPRRGDPEGPPDREFGRQGWLLVAAIVVAFGVVPVTIALRPPDLPFVVAYLVLPLLPAGLLALLAVYVTASR